MAAFDTWGASWGVASAWGTSWFGDDAAPAPAPTPTPTPDAPGGGGGGGGGGPLDMGEESPPLKPIIWEIEPEDRFKPYRERQARLREQLRVALEGPQAEEVRTYVEPAATDSARPLPERVELRTLSDEQIAQIGRYYRSALEWKAEQDRRAAIEARERDIADDDEEVMWLL